MKTGTGKESLLDIAEQLLQTDQSVSAREITKKAKVADGLLIHHFGSYAGLIAILTSRLNKRQGQALESFGGSRGRSQLETAVAFFRELAKLDLNPKNSRLRRMSCEMSWRWKPIDEGQLTDSVPDLLRPLKKHLKFESDAAADEVLMTLWAIYLLPLRLAFNDSILPIDKVKTEDNKLAAIVERIRPKFALILKS